MKLQRAHQHICQTKKQARKETKTNKGPTNQKTERKTGLTDPTITKPTNQSLK